MKFGEAFKTLGFTLSNPRNSWSAEPSSGVCISLWREEVRADGKADVFDTKRDASAFQYWGHKRGNLERLNNLRTAQQKFESQVSVVIVTGTPGKGYEDALPQIGCLWRILYVDPDGNFAVTS